jgi:hypothetical protein
MKQTTKQLLHLAWSGISIALTIFVLIGVVADTICGGRLVFGDWFFSKSAVGVAVSGMAFSLPVLIYDREKLSYGWKILLHLGTGCIVTFLAGIFAGWVPFGNWLLCIVIFFVEIVVSFIGWFFFASYYQNLADKMNRKIWEREPEHGKLLQEASREEEDREGKYKKWSPEMAKRDSFLFFGPRWVMDHPLKNAKEPEWNKLGIKVGLTLLFIFVAFFVIMGSLPESFFDW